MCGIVGLFDLSGRDADSTSVLRVIPVLAHRGPDADRVVSRGPAAFGHTRLAILGLESLSARQPVILDGFLLTYNGEIYNYRELAEQLRREGHEPTDAGDTEVLALCLRYWGVRRTLEAIDGMFSFAWYDPDTRTLTLARDPLGEKPMYWMRNKSRLWFASEIKALLASGEVSREPNLRRIDDYFYTSKVNGAETMYSDIAEVEPGTFVSFRLGEFEEKVVNYWSVEAAFCATKELSHRCLGEKALKEIGLAVGSRCISDVDIGILLSGGIDAATILEQTLSHGPNRAVELFFADNSEKQYSEREDVDLLLKFMRHRYSDAQLDLNVGMLDFKKYFDILRFVTWHYDEPVQFYNSPLLSNLCGIAKNNRLKVLLSGEGSDEIFFGYERFSRTRDFLEGKSDHRSKLEHLYFGGGLHSVDVVQLLTNQVAEGAEATAPWHWLEGNLDNDPDLLQLVYSQKYRLQTLLQRQDRIGMAHSIEIRVPFLRPSLVGWANRLPLRAKFDATGNETKRCLRMAMANRLPERILKKRKDGFPSDMMTWLREPVMHSLANQLIGCADGFCNNYLDGAVAAKLIEEHFSGRRRLDTLVWQLVSLEIWHREIGPAASLH